MIIYFLIFTSFLYSQIDVGINYEMKYSKGENEQSDYFEHYFDINLYKDNLYLYSLLKYKDPALIGSKTKDFDQILDNFYLEYSNDKYLLTAGNIFYSFGSGLSFYSYEDRTIDYNNSPQGLSLLYYLSDNLDLYAMAGTNTFESRTNPSFIEPNISIKNNVMLSGLTFQSNYTDFHYMFMINKQNYNSQTIKSLSGLNNVLGSDLLHKLQYSNLNDYKMTVLEHNFGSNIYLGDLELYFERSWIYHNKIHDERTSGYKYYFSSYLTLADYGILYEYKKYNNPYYYSVYSNPPIVFRETTSVLVSRNLHNIDFSNEVGHHILINKSFLNGCNMIVSSAFAFRQLYDDSVIEPGFGEIFNSMISLESLDNFNSDIKPYRQMYFELNGWNKNDNIFYKIGFDNYYEYSDSKILKAKTIPTQFIYKYNKYNSLGLYFEYQAGNYISSNQNKYSIYFNPSINFKSKIIASLFYNLEKNTTIETEDDYIGVEITAYITNSNILSVFYGSQKGGLICSNGTCVMQPDFDDGIKVTSKFLF